MAVEGQCESEAQFRTTFNQAAVGLAHVALDGRWLAVNQKACDIVGYTREEMQKLTFQDITHPEDLHEDLTLLKSLLRGEIETYSMDKRYIKKDGALVWVQLMVSLVRRPQPDYFISVIEDITARKTAEQVKWSESKQNLDKAVAERDSFFDLALDAMCVLGFDGYFRRVNPAFCELMGYTSEELLARHSLSIVHPEDVEKTVARRTSPDTNTVERAFECRYVAKSGAIRWISWSGKRIAASECYYVTGRHISEQRAQHERAQRAAALQASNSKLEAFGLMAANMAHEINNPLTVILGEGCLLRAMLDSQQTDSAVLHRVADNVVKMSERIVKIISGLRSLSRDGSADPVESVSLRAIIMETIPFCRPKMNAEGIRLKVEEIDPALKVDCRSVQLSQVLLNLINNAIDATTVNNGNREIEILTSISERRVKIHVCDNGPGVSEKMREKIFQPFSTSKPSGLGVGLSIAKNMMDLQNGRLYFDAKAKRTTFVISLPRSFPDESRFQET